MKDVSELMDNVVVDLMGVDQYLDKVYHNMAGQPIVIKNALNKLRKAHAKITDRAIRITERYWPAY